MGPASPFLGADKAAAPLLQMAPPLQNLSFCPEARFLFFGGTPSCKVFSAEALIRAFQSEPEVLTYSKFFISDGAVLTQAANIANAPGASLQ